MNINCVIFMLAFNMVVLVQFLLKSFPITLTYFIVSFLFLLQFLLGTIFHITINVTFKFGFRRVSRCCTMIFFSNSSNKVCLCLRFTGLWLNNFSCLSFFLLLAKFLQQVISQQVNNLPLPGAMFETSAFLSWLTPQVPKQLYDCKKTSLKKITKWNSIYNAMSSQWKKHLHWRNFVIGKCVEVKVIRRTSLASP